MPYEYNFMSIFLKTEAWYLLDFVTITIEFYVRFGSLIHWIHWILFGNKLGPLKQSNVFCTHLKLIDTYAIFHTCC